MANANNPVGLQYVSINHPFPPRTRQSDKLVGTTVAIFQNDAVYEVSGVSGHNAPPIKSFADGATPGVTIALGVALNYGSANLATRHTVIVENVDYVAQDNDGTTGLVQANMGLNACIDVSSVAGSTLTGFSGMQIDKTGVTSAPDTDTSNDLYLRRIYPDVLNAPGPHCRVLVRFLNLREVEKNVGA